MLTEMQAQARLCLVEIFIHDGVEIFEHIRDFVDGFEPRLQPVTDADIRRYIQSLSNVFTVQKASQDLIDKAVVDQEPTYVRLAFLAIRDSLPEYASEVFDAIRRSLVYEAVLQNSFDSDMFQKFFNCAERGLGSLLEVMTENIISYISLLIYSYMTKEEGKKQMALTLLDMCRNGHYPLWITGTIVIFVSA